MTVKETADRLKSTGKFLFKALAEDPPRTIADWEHIWGLLYLIEKDTTFLRLALDGVSPINWRTLKMKLPREDP
jgi:hypothetical protein